MIHIIIHTLPHEIDQLEQTLISLKQSSVVLNGYNVLVDVVLNMNLVNWENSNIPKKFFIDKFNNLEELTKTWAQTKFEINEDGNIQGCVSHRRKAIKETKADAIMFLDTDIYFSDSLLFYMAQSVQILKEQNEYYILTPQITPMWDNTWDVLVNSINQNDNIHFQSRDPYIYSHNVGEVNIKPIDGFKFGGGWATIISTPLAKKTGVPDELGHYGLEDTYIMVCSQIMKQKGIKITQFILENEIIVEDHKFRYNPYKQYISIINKQNEFRQFATNNFENCIKKFGEQL